MEELDVRPSVERWERPVMLWFEDWDEIIGFYGQRVTLPLARLHELRPLWSPGSPRRTAAYT